MPRSSSARRLRPLDWIGAASVTVVAATVVVLAAVWPGFDAQQTPVDDATVWAMQTGAGSGYARVNLELRELDTVKQVENGSQIAQTAQRLFVFSDGGAQFADVDMATPANLTAESDDLLGATPAGTADIATAGDFLGYRTESGDVFGASMSEGGTPVAVDPYAGDEAEEGGERPRFTADAVAVDADGILYAYSDAEDRVLRADAATGRVLGEDDAPGTTPDPQLTAVGGRWALLDDSGALRLQGVAEPVPTGTETAAVVQQTSLTGDAVYIADAAGLVRAPLDGSRATRVVDEGLGTPAAPATVDGVTHAAWLAEGTGGGTLWSSDGGALAELDYSGLDIGDGLEPVLIGNGSRLALNERRSGWVWTVPDGVIVPSSQSWDLEEPVQVEQENELETERVLDPKPPVAVDDAFGVRAGAVASLPVLLNDHDPNEDVLSVDAASIEGLDPAFGAIGLAGAEQQVVVHVAEGATGSATFHYRVTDGTSEDGLLSAPASVTVTVVPDERNTAPVWCGVDGCLGEWPALTVVPGGTVSADVMGAWVDPEGDPLFLTGGVTVTGPGSATSSPESGAVTYQHPDPAASEAVTATLDVTVSDARGAVAQRAMAIDVTPTPHLTAESFAVVGVVGEPTEIAVAPYVTGATGTLTLPNAVTLGPSSATIAPNAAGLTMTVSAEQPGSHVVLYTVRDDRGEATASVRVTFLDPAEATVSTPPLTAFVRPGEDATVDVFPAAANPAGLVLLLDDIRPENDPLASLSVDLVGQKMLRVSGSTEDGQPGRLGVVRYAISDGSGNPATSAQGELTVILLPAPSSEPPIAVDDVVTVRAGAQIDIPVLANDSAPAGALMTIDPSRVVNDMDAGLAFASGSLVRYLAPDRPGTYSLGYTISRLGYPEAVDTASIRVTVVGDENNQAPVPRTLEGRVLSGETVRIPLDGFAVDPDGDAVTLDEITQQPENGSAAISPEGDAIVYTSPETFSGQVRFAYQVHDAQGATATADVRVGVLDAQSDPSPVTYSDYIQLQASETGEAVVRPADNDVDPADRSLELIDVEPNAQAGTDEYRSLALLLGDVEDGGVTLRAGVQPGTFSFTYTVRNTTGDTAIGLIVLKVVREAVPDYPTVKDTILTVETRESFPGGVDVLDGTVSWPTGDIDTLEVQLWGDPPRGVTVSGTEISGDVPDETLLVPFEVSGTTRDGAAVVSYGFLRVPGDNDIRIGLRAGTPPLEVEEHESAELDLTDIIPVPAGRSLEVDGEGVRTGGGRAEADCLLVDGTTIRYTAGAGAPWTDSCIVPVRLDIQDGYTFVTVRVIIDAEIPQPILRSASITVAPGASAEYDLREMVDWAGTEDWDAVDYAVQYSGDQFTLEQSGSIVSVTARDAARPGREERAAVALPSHPDAAASNLNLTVGPAPSTLPKGGTAVQRCSQSSGASSCVVDVIGAGGEVNALPGTPLTLVSVAGPANCPGVAFSRESDTAVRATWAGDAPGASECTGSFVVQDAQGRQSSGERNGQLILDLLGLPAAPTRLEWVRFTGTSVTLRVVSDMTSYPAVDGYRIVSRGQVVGTCTAAGECPAIDAPTGEQRTYEARAFNSVGESRGAVSTTAWAYQSPGAPAGATFSPTPNGTTGGVATITVSGVDPSSGFVRLAGGAGGEVTARVTGTTVVFRDYLIGSNAPVGLTATALTRFDLPTVPGGSEIGGTIQFQAHGIGAPVLSLTATASTSTDPGSITATATATADGVGDRILLGVTDGRFCRPDTALPADRGERTVTFGGKRLWEPSTVVACAVTEFDGRYYGVTEQSADATPTTGIAQPSGDATYRIDGDFSRSGSQFTWAGIDGPSLRAQAPFDVRYRAGGTETADFASLFGLGRHPGTIEAFACNDQWGCSAPGLAVAADGPAYTAQATFPTTCDSGDPAPAATVLANPADYTVATTQSADADGTVTWTYTLTWRNALSGLAPLEGGRAYALTCTPPPAPEPPTVPEPTTPVPPSAP